MMMSHSSRLSPETTLCVSLSARPSPFGTRFHNFLYEQLGLDFVYKGFATQDLEGAIRGVRALGIRSAAISMPFKEHVISLLDTIDPMAKEIGAVNTVIQEQGMLYGLNTDATAVLQLLSGQNILGETDPIEPLMPAIILGSGGMARAVLHALHRRGFQDITLVARNRATGQALAQRTGASYAEKLEDLSITRPASGTESGGLFLINATPIGMHPDNEERVPFDEDWLSRAVAVMDVVASPPKTTLVKRARAAGLPVISGFEIVVAQAVEQFRLATGVTPTAEVVRAAAEHARQ